jgi:hypothetical protein
VKDGSQWSNRSPAVDSSSIESVSYTMYLSSLRLLRSYERSYLTNRVLKPSDLATHEQSAGEKNPTTLGATSSPPPHSQRPDNVCGTRPCNSLR